MDIRALEAFCAAFDEGSFGKACEGLFISRQALSRTMRTLEREVGAPLFVRSGAGVEPTELARMIEPHARRILDEHEAIQADIRKHAQGLSGVLSLAIEPNAVMTLPMGILGRYRDERPDLAITTVSTSGTGVLDELASGAVDAVLSVPFGDESFAYLPVCRGPLCVVMRRADGRAMPEEDLEALRGCVLFGVARDHPIESRIGVYLAQRGVPVRMSYDYPSAMLALDAMNAGLGACIMTASAAERFSWQEGYVGVLLSGDDAPQWEVGVTYRKGSSKEAAIADLAAFLAGTSS